MTHEDKELLLKDLCSRLPYHVRVKVWLKDGTTEEGFLDLEHNYADVLRDAFYYNKIKDIKPYLRPMSSMSEEEAKELLFVRLASKYGESCAYIKNFIKLNEVSFREKSPYKGSTAVWFSFENKIHDTPEIREYSKCEYLGQINDITIAEIDWLNAHHFDYRGLIEKGLAIEAPKGIYK